VAAAKSQRRVEEGTWIMGVGMDSKTRRIARRRPASRTRRTRRRRLLSANVAPPVRAEELR
jgi:hypothetical protein